MIAYAIMIASIWICAAIGSCFTKRVEPFIMALVASFSLFMSIDNHIEKTNPSNIELKIEQPLEND